MQNKCQFKDICAIDMSSDFLEEKEKKVANPEILL